MKNRLLKKGTAILLLTVLSGCASKQNFILPQTMPIQMLQTSNDFTAKYLQLIKAELREDQNGQQFGFDYFTVEFQYGGKERIEIAHSKHSKHSMLRLWHDFGTPNEKYEAVGNDKNKIRFVLSNLEQLTMTAQPKEKRIIEQMILILNGKLASL